MNIDSLTFESLYFENLFERRMADSGENLDPAHDVLHLKRVVQMAKRLCREEKAEERIVIPAAWLHDFVVVPKDSPLRRQASRISAEKAIEYLASVRYPSEFFEGIFHAIEGRLKPWPQF